METSCMWVAGGNWIEQVAVLSTLIVGLGFLASSRGRRLVIELVNDKDAPEPQGAAADTRAA
ncbi:MAG TPA: hypothetical protein VMN43_11545 [Aestuariivirgaceae bacterium]|nr:hypothetical protein [Aestuariivirgaceae bacterium]